MTNVLSGRKKRVVTRSILGILVSLAVAVPTGAATRYVNVGNASPTAPYTTWATAANVIQDAVDAAQPGDEIVVTNGVHETGGRVVHGTLTNRVAVTKPITLRSVNGPGVTVIRGYQVQGATNGDAAVRCVYLGNGASLIGFTVTRGATRTVDYDNAASSGGGVWCESRSATLSNCILSNNSAHFQGGGAYQGLLNNCRLLNNQAVGNPPFAYDFGPGTAAGGGAFEAELNNCVLGNNAADFGGGASMSTLNRCTVVANRATTHGGGSGGVVLRGSIFFGTLNDCLVVSNVAGWSGGGVDGAMVRNCVIARNRAADFGGGALGGSLNNCLVFANQAWVGGGVYIGNLNNCTVTGNAASVAGGGVAGSEGNDQFEVRLNNCIVYSNSAPAGANWTSWFTLTGVAVVFNNSCTTPLPINGTGNVTNAPLFVDPAADNFHLQANSPCINAGLNTYAPDGPDLDGNPRIVGGMVDMGAYEFQTTIRYVNVGNASPTAPYTTWASAAKVIQDAIDVSQPGDEIVVTNGIYETGGRVVHGSLTNRVAVTKPLTLRSVNGPDVTVIRGYPVPGNSAVRCVYLTNGATLVGFTLTRGATRAENDNNVVSSGGGVWCESGTAMLSNCIVSGNAAYFQGGGAYRGILNHCRLLNNQAAGSVSLDSDFPDAVGGGAFEAELNNCVLSNNAADWGGGGTAQSVLNQCTVVANRAELTGLSGGGGAWFGTLNHCLVVSNVARLGGGAFGAVMRNCVVAHNTVAIGSGGGAFAATLNNCMVFANQAGNAGGGVFNGELNNCSITGNSAPIGGGVAGDSRGALPPEPIRLNNCIVYFNSAPFGANWASRREFDVIFTNSCTTPLPTNGIGNITNAPLFVDQAAGNLRLQSNSPCINAGLNAYAPTGPDLDDNPRIAGETVDMGAYEFQSPQSMISYAWLQQLGLPMDGSVDVTDADGDGLNTLQEWRAGTDPTNSLSVLRLLAPSTNGSGLLVRWQSVTNRTYFLERGSNVVGQPAFAPLATDIVGRPDVTTYDDTNAVGSAPFFYRVGVRE